MSFTALRTLVFCRCQSAPPRRLSFTAESFPGADVLAHQVQLGDGHIQGVVFGVAHLDVVLGDAVHLQLVDALKQADAVGGVDHIVPRRQLRQAGNLLAVLVPLHPLALDLCHAAVGNQGEVRLRQLKPCRQRPQRHHHRAGVHRGSGVHPGGRQPGPLQVPRPRPCPPASVPVSTAQARPWSSKARKSSASSSTPAAPGGELLGGHVHQRLGGDFIAAPGEQVQEQGGGFLRFAQGVLPVLAVLVQALAQQALRQVAFYIFPPLPQGGAHPLFQLVPLGEEQQAVLRREVVKQRRRLGVHQSR